MIVKDDDCLENYRHGPCEWCGKRGRTDPHHLTCRGIGGGHRLDIPENMLALCRSCHDLVHAGKIKRDEMVAVVARRQKTTPEAIMEHIYLLRRTKK